MVVGVDAVRQRKKIAVRQQRLAASAGQSSWVVGKNRVAVILPLIGNSLFAINVQTLYCGLLTMTLGFFVAFSCSQPT